MKKSEVAILVHEGAHKKICGSWRDWAVLIMMNEMEERGEPISVPEIEAEIVRVTKMASTPGLLRTSMKNFESIGFIKWGGRKLSKGNTHRYVVTPAGKQMVKVLEELMESPNFFAG